MKSVAHVLIAAVLAGGMCAEAAGAAVSPSGHHGMHADGGGTAAMAGMLGAYPVSREASGTSWQPDLSPVEGVTGAWGETAYMYQAAAALVYDVQGGPRGATKIFSTNMLMFMAHRPLAGGTLGFRSMLSLEPWSIGAEGYPLLLQTGETADGVTPLVDRQHPHDMFMELSCLYSLPVAAQKSVFLYAGLPGEPALGPATFMHRYSAKYIPDAPLTHHWLDSTHITFGVITAGYVARNIKIEGSAFRGREPDERRWDLESPRLDSYAARVSVNPSTAWALQASCGLLYGAEQLHPRDYTTRATASATNHRRLAKGHWQTTGAWGRNCGDGVCLDGFLLESACSLPGNHVVFVRAETVQKNELFDIASPAAGEIFQVSKGEVGYAYVVPLHRHWYGHLGVSGAVHGIPGRLKPVYGDAPASWMFFAGIQVR